MAVAAHEAVGLRRHAEHQRVVGDVLGHNRAGADTEWGTADDCVQIAWTYATP